MKFSFNTGRQYTAEGQVITAEVKGKHILFFDHSRMIAGAVPLLTTREMSRFELSGLLMYNYDRGNYSPSEQAMNLERVDPVVTYRY